MRELMILFVAFALVAFVGCGEKETGGKGPAKGTGPKAEGKATAAPKIAFAAAWSTNPDAAAAAKAAATDALKQLEAKGVPPRGLVFYEYFPKTIKVTAKDDAGKEVEKDAEVPDTEKEKLVLPAIRSVAKGVPTIGCRAKSLVADGAKQENTVACLAIGGDAVSTMTTQVELADDRKAVGTTIGRHLKDVKDLKLILALSEMRLSFETKEGVSVEDFIRGVLDAAGKDVTLFGGNCMPNDPDKDRAGVQFNGDQMLSGHVVAMGIGGPLAIHANHTNEFDPSAETATVTKADDKWIYEFDGKPAPEVYRTIRGMKPDEEFTSDWQHPIGVIVAPEKVYLRMVLEENKEKKGLRFVAAVPVGTKVKILKGGADAKKIVESAKEGIVQSLYKAGDAPPLAVLLSDCCARGMRLLKFRTGQEDEVTDAIAPALKDKGDVPVFGFYAWGELGPIAGPFAGLNCMYQQHTFVSAVITEAK